MKKLVALLLGAVVLLALALGGASVALADAEHHHEPGELQVTFSSSPRFPVAGQEALLTFTISNSGNPEQGLTVHVVIAEASGGGHDDGDEHSGLGTARLLASVTIPPLGASPTLADVGHEHEEEHQEEAAPVELIATEEAPGVYVVKHTFDRDGKYQVTAHIGDEHAEFTVSVRSQPVAWPLVIGLGAAVLGTAAVVAVIKTVKRDW